VIQFSLSELFFEHSFTIWNPVYKYDIIKLEAVQRRFLKRLDGLHSLSYNMCRVDRLGLESLYSRRVKADLVKCYKILNNHVCVDVVDSFFTRRVGYHTRGNCVKLYKIHTASVRDGHFFSNRACS